MVEKLNICPSSSNFLINPLPLAGVFELVKSENNEIKIDKLKILNDFILFTHNTYRNFLIPL